MSIFTVSHFLVPLFFPLAATLSVSSSVSPFFFFSVSQSPSFSLLSVFLHHPLFYCILLRFRWVFSHNPEEDQSVYSSYHAFIFSCNFPGIPFYLVLWPQKSTEHLHLSLPPPPTFSMSVSLGVMGFLFLRREVLRFPPLSVVKCYDLVTDLGLLQKALKSSTVGIQKIA